MTTYYLRVDMDFMADPPDDADSVFDAFCDRVMDALADLEQVNAGIIDPSAAGSLRDKTLSILMGIEADSERDAARLFSANVRTALHAAGCYTPGWPAFKPAETDLEPQLV